jgi:hypothetical protein
VTVDTDIVGGDDENNAQYYSSNFANRDIRNLVGKMIDVKTFRIFSTKLPKQFLTTGQPSLPFVDFRFTFLQPREIIQKIT